MNLKKILILILVLFVITSTFILVNNKKNKNVEPIQVANLQDKTFCYEYVQEATDTEPYSVNENLKLVFSGDIVSGVKTGFQSGPNMTNGYTGEIDGFIKGEKIEALFSYEIEGSKQSEREVYKIEKTGLQKLRYELEDRQGVLVPNLDKLVTIQEYKIIDC